MDMLDVLRSKIENKGIKRIRKTCGRSEGKWDFDEARKNLAQGSQPELLAGAAEVFMVQGMGAADRSHCL